MEVFIEKSPSVVSEKWDDNNSASRTLVRHPLMRGAGLVIKVPEGFLTGFSLVEKYYNIRMQNTSWVKKQP